ncbi:unnamed protein product [Caenorhabditis auriculariae]|uniref:Tc1-like transposase DDE domain-containing protein n=1 Tax=Caenorhabditis auriculariae TaxID=2777116 RepID=A0A8S1GW76_9PELO|nr:unnamed protein product [Caenorhabditis auriculariae]
MKKGDHGNYFTSQQLVVCSPVVANGSMSKAQRKTAHRVDDRPPLHLQKIQNGPRLYPKELSGFIDTLEWPPYTPDLNPLDYSVWDNLKFKSYATPHCKIEPLKASLEREKIGADYLSATALPKRLRVVFAITVLFVIFCIGRPLENYFQTEIFGKLLEVSEFSNLDALQMICVPISFLASRGHIGTSFKIEGSKANKVSSYYEGSVATVSQFTSVV